MENSIEAEISGAVDRAIDEHKNRYPGQARDSYNHFIKWIDCLGDNSDEKSEDAGQHFVEIWDYWLLVYQTARDDSALSPEAKARILEADRRLYVLYKMLINDEGILREAVRIYREAYSYGELKLPPMNPYLGALQNDRPVS